MLTKMKLLAAAGTLAAATLASPAMAATYQFDFTSSQYTASFQLPSAPFPSQIGGSSPYHYAAFDGVAGTLNGAAYTFDGLIFPASDYTVGGATGGGFSFEYNFNYYFQGAQLFTGTVGNPVFATGTFLLSSYNTGLPGTLVIRDLAAAVPEPATWAMMLAGFGMIGFAARRRSSVKTTIAYA